MSETENHLLQQIRLPFPAEKNEQFNFLIAKRDANTLTSNEYEELLSLTDAFEEYELKRLRLMAKLANLREITLPELVVLYNLYPK